MKKQIEKIRQQKIDYILAKKKNLFIKYGISYRSFHRFDDGTSVKPIGVINISNPNAGMITCEFFSQEFIDSLDEETIMRCAVQIHDGKTVTEKGITGKLWKDYDQVINAYKITEQGGTYAEILFENSLKLVQRESELSDLQSLVKESSDILNKANI
jgi:hypothetical protein